MTTVRDNHDQLLGRVKDFWNRRPCNIRHSTQPVGTKEYFDEVDARRYFVEPHILDFAEFEKWRDKRVLEIGCGIGTDTVRFAKAGAQITATDLSEASLDICRQRFDIYGLDGSFYAANGEELSDVVPVETYDLIYSFGVIHHSPSPRSIIEELTKYGGPNTEFRIMLYAKWSWKVLWILFAYGKGAFWRLPALIRQNSEAESGCPVTFAYSCKGARQLLEGYEIIEMRKAHIFPYKIEKYVKYEYEKVWYFAWMPQKLFNMLQRQLGWHLLITARLKDPGSS